MTLQSLQNITYARANPSLWYVIVKRETPVTYYNHKGSIGEMNKTSTLQTLTVVLTVLVLALMAFQVTILNIRVNIILSNRAWAAERRIDQPSLWWNVEVYRFSIKDRTQEME